MASKSDEKWMANYKALKAYIDEHHHLPPKNAHLGAKYLLNFAKYVRRTIKVGTCDDWKKEMFERLMEERHLDEHKVSIYSSFPRIRFIDQRIINYVSNR